MTVFDEAASVLTSTRELIQRKGWCQHHFNDELGRVCLAQAVALTYNSAPPSIDARQLVEHSLRRIIRRGNENFISVIQWNDSPGRTEEQVLQLIDETIHDLQPWSAS